MRVMPCATCSKVVDLTSVKYYTADQQHVFCDAYCSHDWYSKIKDSSNERSSRKDDKVIQSKK